MIPPTNFWSRVEKTETCWIWTASKTSGGYGNLRIQGGKYAYAHRIAWEISRGPIPEGFVIDHLCRNRGCVNPEHLEPVTSSENCRRGASAYGAVRNECKHGHNVSDPSNVYTDRHGYRRCRACASAHDKRRAEARARERQSAKC